MMIVVLIKVASFYRKRVWKVHGEADGHYSISIRAGPSYVSGLRHALELSGLPCIGNAT
jgi:hypothetical protein